MSPFHIFRIEKHIGDGIFVLAISSLLLLAELSTTSFAEIEYCIGEEFQCRGYATEATKAVIAYGFEKINLHKVQICTKTINAKSKRVIEKCGFVYEGTLRDYFCMDGKYVGRLYFSILRDEYMNR